MSQPEYFWTIMAHCEDLALMKETTPGEARGLISDPECAYVVYGTQAAMLRTLQTMLETGAFSQEAMHIYATNGVYVYKMEPTLKLTFLLAQASADEDSVAALGSTISTG